MSAFSCPQLEHFARSLAKARKSFLHAEGLMFISPSRDWLWTKMMTCPLAERRVEFQFPELVYQVRRFSTRNLHVVTRRLDQLNTSCGRMNIRANAGLST